MNKNTLILICSLIEGLLFLVLTLLFLNERISLTLFLALMVVVGTLSATALILIIKHFQNK